MSYSRVARPLASVSLIVKTFTTSARIHDSTDSAATDRFQLAAAPPSAAMNRYASTPALPAPFGNDAAGISVNPSNVFTFNANPCSADTATNPVSFCAPSGHTPATSTDFGGSDNDRD